MWLYKDAQADTAGKYRWGWECSNGDIIILKFDEQPTEDEAEAKASELEAIHLFTIEELRIKEEKHLELQRKIMLDELL